MRSETIRHEMMAANDELVASGDSQRTSIATNCAVRSDENWTATMGSRTYSRLSRHHNSRPRKAENILLRLMRHFSSNSTLGSSHYNHVASNGYANLPCGGHETKHIPSSVSNGDIRHQCQTISNNITPAVTGIKNHGNTCFMNAILQCLSNTDLFAEYFVLNHYRNDLSKRNKIHAKKYGTRGEVTEQLAELLKSLWSNQYTSEISSKFKNLVAKYGPQYDGNDQHDAQEFLLWLLDKIHEDLNIATKKKYKKFKNMYNHNRPDDVIAAETLANHMRCNSSFIHELFQAQLRSSLVCRSCGNSNTFDPYLCLSLPVPARQTHTIIVNVTYLKKSPREVKIGVSIESQATLRELRDKISRLIKVPERQLVLSIKDEEIGINELAKDTDLISDILDDMQEIDAVETLPVYPSHVIDTSCSPSPTAQLLILIWRNCIKEPTEKRHFGPMFTCQVSREAHYKQVQSEILNTMKPIIRRDVDLNIPIDDECFKLRIVFVNSNEKYFLPQDVDHPLYMPAVDKALSSSEHKDYRGPVHLKLVVEWSVGLREELFLSDEALPVPVVDSNIEYVKSRTQKANRASLSDCFEMYFREEKLAGDNAWVCPVCKRRQQCIKRLSLWSVPQVFIVHLKRFRQASSTQRNKLSTLVLFPLNGLDMNPYLVPKLKFNHHQHQKLNSTNGSVVNTLPASHRHSRYTKNEENVFDLYAVCNHNGNMQSGHYTAFCKNPVDGQWYAFDDTKVTNITDDSVVTADAYILFYQRRINYSSLSSCASSSTSGYSSSASSCYCSSEHWAFKLPSSSCSSPKSSHSQELLSQMTTPILRTSNRGHRNYASLPSKSSQKHMNLWSANECNAMKDKEIIGNGQQSNKSSETSNDSKSETSVENGEKGDEISAGNDNHNTICETTNNETIKEKKYWTVTSV